MNTDPHEEARKPPAERAEEGRTEDIGTADHAGDGSLKDQVIDALRTVYDPEIPVNIHALGLIYGVLLSDEGHCKITMTLTSPNCPAAESLPGEVETKARAVPGITGVSISLVWDPPWSMENLTEEARLVMGL